MQPGTEMGRGHAAGGPALAPTRARRLAVATLLGFASGAAVWLLFLFRPESTASDFDIVWLGARGLLAGRDPWAVLRSSGWPWPLHYPLPTLVAVAPFALLPRAAARALFAALTSGVLAYVITRRAWWPLWMFASGAYVYALRAVQWSPLLCALALLPRARGLLVLKPSIGLALTAVTRNGREFLWLAGVSGAVVAFSFAVWSPWLAPWLHAIANAPHIVPPAVRPGGVLLLLALLRWRRPEARLLAALACVPYATYPYESLPVLLTASNRREMVWLVEGSLLALVIQAVISYRLGDATQAERLTWIWPPMFLLVYLPALVMVLVRPNVAGGDAI
jgi:hypothetical protein